MFLFAGLGAALSAFMVVLLIALGILGVAAGIWVLAVCWTAGCVYLALKARGHERLGLVLAVPILAATVAAFVTGFAADPIGTDVMLLVGLTAFTWARVERKAARRRAFLAALAARDARRGARRERWASLVRKRA